MAFRLPTFNMVAAIYNHYGPPFLPRPVPRVTALCQLRLMRTAFASNQAAAITTGPLLLVPKLTDIRPSSGFGASIANPDIVEVPQNSGRFYTTVQVEDVSKGFTNEHRAAQLSQLPLAVPFPIP